MNHALEILSALEAQLAPKVLKSSHTCFSGTIEGADYHIAWRLGDRRLNHICREEVLTIDAIELSEEIRGTGVLTELIERVLTGDPAPRIPLRFLHFKDCGPGLGSLLERLNFNPYRIANSIDWWKPVTGQKELL